MLAPGRGFVIADKAKTAHKNPRMLMISAIFNRPSYLSLRMWFIEHVSICVLHVCSCVKVSVCIVTVCSEVCRAGLCIIAADARNVDHVSRNDHENTLL